VSRLFTSLALFLNSISKSGVATDGPDPAKLAVKLKIAVDNSATIFSHLGQRSGSFGSFDGVGQRAIPWCFAEPSSTTRCSFAGRVAAILRFLGGFKCIQQTKKYNRPSLAKENRFGGEMIERGIYMEGESTRVFITLLSKATVLIC